MSGAKWIEALLPEWLFILNEESGAHQTNYENPGKSRDPPQGLRKKPSRLTEASAFDFVGPGKAIWDS